MEGIGWVGKGLSLRNALGKIGKTLLHRKEVGDEFPSE